MQLKQIGAVFLIAFMCTGMFGYVLNTEMVTVDAKSYNSITPGESIVYNTGVTQWEEYNPVTNLTSQRVMVKQGEAVTPTPIHSWESGDCTVTLYNNGELRVSGNGQMADYSYDNKAPWLKTSIYSSQISSIYIESGVTTIGAESFQFITSQVSVVIGDTVSRVNSKAFQLSFNVTQLTFTAKSWNIQYDTDAFSFGSVQGHHIALVTVYSPNNMADGKLQGILTDFTYQEFIPTPGPSNPQPSNVTIPLTTTPSKYIYKSTFKGYYAQKVDMNTDWLYNPLWEDWHTYQDLDPFHWVHYVGYEMNYMYPGHNEDSGIKQNARVYTSDGIHFYDDGKEAWGGFSQNPIDDDQHTDENKDWINYGTEKEPNWYSIPKYGGGYGTTMWGLDDYKLFDFEIRMKVEFYKNGLVSDSTLDKTIYNSPKAYIMMYPIATKLIGGGELPDKAVIGTSSVTSSGATKITNLYGLAYVGNTGEMITEDDLNAYHKMQEMSDSYPESSQEIKSFGVLTYTYKLTQLRQDSQTQKGDDGWIYDKQSGLFYPAYRTQSGEFNQDTTRTGVRYLVFLDYDAENVSDNPKTNWSMADKGVSERTKPDYQDTYFPDTKMSFLTVWTPIYGQVQYVDPYQWTYLNTDEKPLYNGALTWDNGERTGVIKYWGQPGLRVGADNTNDEGSYDGVSLKNTPHSNVWWTIPDGKYPYKYYICTIDLLNKTATCEGVIGDPKNPLEYTTSGVIYDMVAYSDLHDGEATKDEWPEYFDAVKDKSDNYLDYAMLVTYQDYKPQNYGDVTKDVSEYHNLRFYVLSTIVSTDPDGKLWSDPSFYLGYYLPDVFGGKQVDHIFVFDEGKETEKKINIPVYLTQDNGRFYIKSSVAYGKSFTINGEIIDVNDGTVKLEVNKDKFKIYPVNGLQVEFLIQHEGETPIGTKVYLTHNDFPDLMYPVGGVEDGSYSWKDENYPTLRGWMNPTQITVPISSESTITIPEGTLIEGNGIWYFSSNIDLIQITHVQKKALNVDGGMYTLSVAGSVLIFLGISLVGLAGLCYYTNQRIPFLGWIVIGGVVMIALQLAFAFQG